MSNLPEQNWSIVLGSIEKKSDCLLFHHEKSGYLTSKGAERKVWAYMKLPMLWKEVSKVPTDKKVWQMNKNYCVETIVKFCSCKSQRSCLLDRYTPGSGLVQLSCLSVWPEMMSQ